MKKQQAETIDLKFHPVTKKRWADFETLFGAKGACGGCWCMLWRLTRKEFEQQKGEANRRAMKAIIESGAYSLGTVVLYFIYPCPKTPLYLYT